MTTSDRIKNIQWLFVCYLLLASSAFLTIDNLVEKVNEQLFSFEEKLVNTIVWGDLPFPEIKGGLTKLVVSESDKERLFATVDFLNERKLDYLRYIDSDELATRGMEHQTTVRGLEIKLSNQLFIELKMFELPDSKVLSRPNDYSNEPSPRVLLLFGKWLRDLIIVGDCQIVKSSENVLDRLMCNKERSQVFFRNSKNDTFYPSDGFVDNEIDVDEFSQNARKLLIEDGSKLPILNITLPPPYLVYGFLLVLFFLQVYTLSTLRTLSGESLSGQGWLFVSWMYSDKVNVVDNISVGIEGIAGVSAYFTMVGMPVIILYQAHRMQNLWGEVENLYAVYIASAILSALVFYYLIQILCNNYKLQRNSCRQTSQPSTSGMLKSDPY